MALIKSKMTQFGIEADYWKLNMISVDRNLKEGSFSLSLYLRKGEKQFLETETVSLLGLEDKTLYEECFENLDTNIHTSCYNFAKKHIAFFNDAISDID